MSSDLTSGEDKRSKKRAPSGMVLISEAARVLGLSEFTVRDYCRRGVLPHYRPFGARGRYVFRLEELESFLAATSASVKADMSDANLSDEISFDWCTAMKGVLQRMELVKTAAEYEAMDKELRELVLHAASSSWPATRGGCVVFAPIVAVCRSCGAKLDVTYSKYIGSFTEISVGKCGCLENVLAKPKTGGAS